MVVPVMAEESMTMAVYSNMLWHYLEGTVVAVGVQAEEDSNRWRLGASKVG